MEATAQMLALCLLVTGVFYGTQRMETAAVNGISQAVYQRELKEAEKTSLISLRFLDSRRRMRTRTALMIPRFPMENPQLPSSCQSRRRK